jgi:hypothetical protein
VIRDAENDFEISLKFEASVLFTTVHLTRVSTPM